MAPLLAHKPGVDRAFERIYRRHAVDVYRYAFAVLRNQADAEDVTQTTFMNAYRALERGEKPETPHNWLIAIAHNVCRQRFRQAARRVREVGLEEDVADHFVHPEDDDAPSPADIKRALNQLAFNQRAALVMRELEGRSYAEIASLLDLSVGAVETLIFRARRALREQLESALTCGQTEQLLSRQLDGELAKDERGQLRAHLRECAACRRLARSQRAQRSALRALGAIPLPSSLASLFGGGASVGTAVAVKAAAVVITAGVVGGVGYDVHHQLAPPPTKARPHAVATTTTTRAAVPALPAVAVAVAHPPVVAAAVPPARAHRRARPQPERHARPQGTPPAGPQAPSVAEQPSPAAPGIVSPHTVGRGRAEQQPKPQAPHGHGHGHGNSRATGHGPASDVPATDPAAPPSEQRHGRPDNPGSPKQGDSGKPANSGKQASSGKPAGSGKPDSPQGQAGQPVTVPALPVTVPEATVTVPEAPAVEPQPGN